ncbi:hypothetical protein A2U01_0094953, partial [Trifolium medium]|nr:hypothetical protein [Trifolium medium]
DDGAALEAAGREDGEDFVEYPECSFSSRCLDCVLSRLRA